MNAPAAVAAQITALLDERDVRYYDEGRIAFKGNKSAGEVVRDVLSREPLLDDAGAAAFAGAIREHVIPNAPAADLQRIVEALRDCPRKGVRS